MKNLLYKYKSELSTLAGLLVAIGTAWSTIDFSTFVFTTDWHKLIIPAMIAIGGYVTKINVERDDK
jgi:hypothetical protein